MNALTVRGVKDLKERVPLPVRRGMRGVKTVANSNAYSTDR